jgi:hypothetical protein
VSPTRRILLLGAATASAADLAAIAGMLALEGATVVVREAGADYDALLDEIARAEVVVCWR